MMPDYTITPWKFTLNFDNSSQKWMNSSNQDIINLKNIEYILFKPNDSIYI